MEANFYHWCLLSGPPRPYASGSKDSETHRPRGWGSRATSARAVLALRLRSGTAQPRLPHVQPPSPDDVKRLRRQRADWRADAEAQVPLSLRIPVPVGPVPQQHEGDTPFELRAPLPPPRHRGEEGKRPRGTSGRVGAPVARPRADGSLAGPGNTRGRPGVPRPPGFIWLQWLLFKARVTPATVGAWAASLHFTLGGGQDPTSLPVLSPGPGSE